MIVLAVRGPRLLFFLLRGVGIGLDGLWECKNGLGFIVFFMGPMMAQFKVQSSLFTFFTSRCFAQRTVFCFFSTRSSSTPIF